jgi:NTP pyrophosphatase (non-canonical NTP hydrolase)
LPLLCSRQRLWISVVMPVYNCPSQVRIIYTNQLFAVMLRAIMLEVKPDALPVETRPIKIVNITEITQEFRAIAATNGWEEYHTPKNLAAAIAVEASELLAEFQWLTPEQSSELNSQQKAQVASEIADVVMYLTELCEQLDIDMADAIKTKINTNKQRFQKL